MSRLPPSLTPGRIRVVAVVICCVLAGIAFGGAAGVVAADDTAENTTSGTVTVENATGNTTLLVQLADPTVSVADEEEPLSPSDLRDRVEPTQSTVADQIDSIPGAEVDTRFWITNVLVVEIDVDRVDPAVLADIDHVERVDAETTLSLTDTTPRDVASVSEAAATGPRLSTTNAISPTLPEGSTPGSIDSLSTPATYGLDLHRVPDAWDATGTQGAGARVAVLDTGVNESHPDIDLVTGGWAEFDERGVSVDSTPHDPNGHGTHVSGTATGGNASGTAIGVAPDAELYHAKVFPGDERETTGAAVIAGIQWAVENDADVATLSVGAEDYFPAFIDPIQNAQAAGTVVVSSSGNLGENTSTSPGNVYDGLAVGAVDEHGDVPPFSSGETVVTHDTWGSDAPDDWPDEYVVPDLSAAGVAVSSASNTGGYDIRSGTSMAAPHVAGVVALVRATDPSLSVETTEAAIRSTAVHPTGDGPDDRHGHGLIDANATLTAATTGTISGTVTDAAGDPVVNATIEADNKTTTTNIDGEYTLTTATGEHGLNVSAFGFQTANQTVSVTAMTATTTNVTLSNATDARLLRDQPAEADAGTSFTVEFEVANVDSITTDTNGETGIPGESVSLTVGNEAVSPGTSIQFNGTRSEVVTLTVETDPNTAGVLELSHTFAGTDGEVKLSTGPTTIDSQGAAMELTNVTTPDVVERFEAYTVTATVENVGNESGTDTVQYWIGDDPTNATDVTLDPDENTTVSWNVTYTQPPGEYTQRITTAADTQDRPLTIEGDMIVDDYRNDEDELTISGLRSAIDDFSNGAIEIRLLRDVIDAFAAG